MRRRTLLFAAWGAVAAFALGLALGGSARAQPAPHWLIGTWTGVIKDLREKFTNERLLVVIAVDGTDATLRYSFPDGATTAVIHGTLQGEELRFVSIGKETGDNTITVKRDGPDGLSGTWLSAHFGKTYRIVFQRQKTP